jgi:hypothetical protein
MVEMDVQGRHLQVVMAMLRLGDAPSQLAGLVVVDVGERGDAEGLVARLRQPLARLGLAQDVARCFFMWRSRVEARSSSIESVMRCMPAPGGRSARSVGRGVAFVQCSVAAKGQGA